ncbi:hypothetical protein ABE222_27890, partial [Bacillus tropicus]
GVTGPTGAAGTDGVTGPTGAAGILGTSNVMLSRNTGIASVASGTAIIFDLELANYGGTDIVFTPPNASIMLKENNLYLVSFTAFLKANAANMNISIGLKLNDEILNGSMVTQDQASNTYNITLSNTIIVDTNGQSALASLQFCVLQSTIDFAEYQQNRPVVITIIKIT